MPAPRDARPPSWSPCAWPRAARSTRATASSAVELGNTQAELLAPVAADDVARARALGEDARHGAAAPRRRRGGRAASFTSLKSSRSEHRHGERLARAREERRRGRPARSRGSGGCRGPVSGVAQGLLARAVALVAQAIELVADLHRVVARLGAHAQAPLVDRGSTPSAARRPRAWRPACAWSSARDSSTRPCRRSGVRSSKPVRASLEPARSRRVAVAPAGEHHRAQVQRPHEAGAAVLRGFPLGHGERRLGLRVAVVAQEDERGRGVDVALGRGDVRRLGVGHEGARARQRLRRRGPGARGNRHRLATIPTRSRGC